MTKPGDIVAFCELFFQPDGSFTKVDVIGQIVKWPVDPDEHIVVIDVDEVLHRTYRDRCLMVGEARGDRLVTSFEGVAEVKRLTDLALRKDDIQAEIKALRAPDPDEVRWRGKVAPREADDEFAAPGAGHLEPWELPDRMAKGKSSKWSRQLQRRLYWSEDEERRFFQAVEELKSFGRRRGGKTGESRAYQLFHAVVMNQQRPVDAARQLGIAREHTSRDLRKAIDYVNTRVGWNVVDAFAG